MPSTSLDASNWPKGSIALFGLLWGDLLHLLSYSWSHREQYSYGWFVPVFAVYLGWLRWMDRPAPQPVVVGGGSYALAALVAALMLPLRLAFEINADWPLIAWCYSLMLVLLTLEGIRLAGGMPWVRHFAFPVGFLLLGVAWPERIEKGLTQNLMQVVAKLSVETLGWMDVPAIQRGNLIEVKTGVVGVDEACSGIRSLQTTLMAGLLVGEIFRLATLPRILLLLSGLGVAFVINLLRTLFLGWQASQHGVGIVEAWHDRAGLIGLALCISCLWGLGTLLKRRRRGATAVDPVPLSCSNLAASLPPDLRRAGRFLGLVGLWGLFVLATTEVWYRVHDHSSSGQLLWTISLPTDKPGYKELDLTPRVRALMQHDEAAAGSWREDETAEWLVYFFRWRPRPIQAVMMARAHRPEVCLPATGFRQIGESSALVVEAGPFKVPFRAYTYQIGEKTVHVFFCQWEDSTKNQAGIQATKQGDRLQSVLAGRRRVAQQTLELIMTGYADREQAERSLRRTLPALVRSEELSTHRPPPPSA